MLFLTNKSGGSTVSQLRRAKSHAQYEGKNKSRDSTHATDGATFCEKQIDTGVPRQPQHRPAVWKKGWNLPSRVKQDCNVLLSFEKFRFEMFTVLVESEFRDILLPIFWTLWSCSPLPKVRLPRLLFLLVSAPSFIFSLVHLSDFSVQKAHEKKPWKNSQTFWTFMRGWHEHRLPATKIDAKIFFFLSKKHGMFFLAPRVI